MPEADLEGGAGGTPMTTPGGVPNLPVGALTLETLASKLQDMSGGAMKARAVERFPSIFGGSTGGSPASDITPFGILTGIWAEVNSLVATSDPADIQGPEDLPPLLLEFIEGIPVVGQLVGLLEAILGTYDGDDETLLTIQQIFAPVRALVAAAGDIIPPWRLPQISISSLFDGEPNLDIAGTFPTADSIADNPFWTWDSTVTRTVDGTGTGLVVADGTFKALRGNEIEITNGRPIKPTAWVKWEGLAATGVALRLDLVTFTGPPGARVQTGIVTIASITGPAASSDWVELTGSWTATAGVTMVKKRLVVTSGATAGVIHWDDAETIRTGLLLISWMKNLAALFGVTDIDLDGDIDVADVWNSWWMNVAKALGWIPTVVQDVIDGIHNGYANFGEAIEADLPRGAALDTVYALLGLNLDAKTSIAVLDAEVRLLKSEGNTLRDDFERPDASSPGADYADLHTGGGGAGGMGIRNGVLIWIPSGSGNRWRMYRYTPAQITTDSFEMNFVLASDPPSTFPDDAYSYALFRCSNSETSYGRLRIGRTSIVLQAVVTGTVYTITSASAELRAGDYVTIIGGAAGNTALHTYSVLRKGQPIINAFTDPSTRVKTGSGFRGMGAGGETSLRIPISIIPIPTQWVPASFAAMTMAEIL